MSFTSGLATTAPVSLPSPLRRAWSLISNVFTTVLTCAVVVVATLSVAIAVATHLGLRGEYTVFGHPVMTVLSGSMGPTVRTGDLVIDRAITSGQATHLHVGQIISFRSGPGAGANVFTHRIHGLKTQGSSVAYQTKGDANNSVDTTLVPPSRVIGVYQGKVPYGGYVLNALHKPAALVLLLTSPILALVSVWLFGLSREAGKGNSSPARDAGRSEASVM